MYEGLARHASTVLERLSHLERNGFDPRPAHTPGT
jgi:hypothetical protein